jgi:gliding motility-associated lipoprotein GldH
MEIAIKRTRTYVLLLATFILFAACDATGVFDEYRSLEENVWSQEEPVEFEFKVSDTLAQNQLYINIRNNNDYEYSNLFLITHLNAPNGKKIVDTLEYAMADQMGEFLGSGISEIKESKLWYKENYVFSVEGDYKLSIHQAMRSNGSVEGVKALEGVTDVGFRIEKAQ